jgi:hypothetical protein
MHGIIIIVIIVIIVIPHLMSTVTDRVLADATTVLVRRMDCRRRSR